MKSATSQLAKQIADERAANATLRAECTRLEFLLANERDRVEELEGLLYKATGGEYGREVDRRSY